MGGIRSRYADIQKASVTRSINQYLTHWFYPYKGKFHPQMIRALANILKVRHSKEQVAVELASDHAIVRMAGREIRWPSNKGLTGTIRSAL